MKNLPRQAWPIICAWQDLPKQIAWHYGYELISVKWKKQGCDWLCILVAKAPQARLVSFVGAQTFLELQETLVESIEKGRLTWKPDQY